MSLADVINQQVDLKASGFTNAERKTYRGWRIRIIYATIFGYAAFYLLRNSYAFVIPSLTAEFGYTKTELALVSSAFYFVYGAGRLINGYLSDRSDARYFMSIGLLLSSIVCFMIGLTGNFWLLAILWVMNGWFQSMGWPPTARLISHWYSPRELGTKWAMCSSSHQVGAFAIALLAPYLIIEYGWQYAFFIPAMISAVFAFFVFDRVRDTPKEVGLRPVEEYKGDVHNIDPAMHDRITLKEVYNQVLKNKLVWFVGIGNICLYFPRLGIVTWAPTFLKEVKGIDLQWAGAQFAGFEVAGLFGGLLAGWLSDKVFGSRRGPVASVFLVCTAAALYLEWMIPAGFPLLDTLVLITAGFFLYGPQVLAGLAATDFATKRAAGVATGFIGVMASIGAVCGGGVGFIVDNYGWEAGFMLFVISALIGAFFFSLTWHHRAKVLDQPEDLQKQSFNQSPID